MVWILSYDMGGDIYIKINYPATSHTRMELIPTHKINHILENFASCKMPIKIASYQKSRSQSTFFIKYH